MKLYIEGKCIDDIPQMKYLIIHVRMNAWHTKMLFTIDAGHDFNSKTKITNEQGVEVKLNSEADLLNYLHACGYEFMNMYIVSQANGGKVHKFIFKKVD